MLKDAHVPFQFGQMFSSTVLTPGPACWPMSLTCFKCLCVCVCVCMCMLQKCGLWNNKVRVCRASSSLLHCSHLTSLICQLIAACQVVLQHLRPFFASEVNVMHISLSMESCDLKCTINFSQKSRICCDSVQQLICILESASNAQFWFWMCCERKCWQEKHFPWPSCPSHAGLHWMGLLFIHVI